MSIVEKISGEEKQLVMIETTLYADDVLCFMAYSSYHPKLGKIKNVTF